MSEMNCTCIAFSSTLNWLCKCPQTETNRIDVRKNSESNQKQCERLIKAERILPGNEICWVSCPTLFNESAIHKHNHNWIKTQHSNFHHCFIVMQFVPLNWRVSADTYLHCLIIISALYRNINETHRTGWWKIFHQDAKLEQRPGCRTSRSQNRSGKLPSNHTEFKWLSPLKYL